MSLGMIQIMEFSLWRLAVGRTGHGGLRLSRLFSLANGGTKSRYSNDTQSGAIGGFSSSLRMGSMLPMESCRRCQTCILEKPLAAVLLYHSLDISLDPTNQHAFFIPWH